MSADTYRAVEDAIRAHIADRYNEPRVVTDWVVLSANQGLDSGSTGYFYITPRGISAHVLTGLIGHFLRNFEHRHIAEAEDGDDAEETR